MLFQQGTGNFSCVIFVTPRERGFPIVPLIWFEPHARSILVPLFQAILPAPNTVNFWLHFGTEGLQSCVKPLPFVSFLAEAGLYKPDSSLEHIHVTIGGETKGVVLRRVPPRERSFSH